MAYLSRWAAHNVGKTLREGDPDLKFVRPLSAVSAQIKDNKKLQPKAEYGLYVTREGSPFYAPHTDKTREFDQSLKDLLENETGDQAGLIDITQPPPGRKTLVPDAAPIREALRVRNDLIFTDWANA